MILSNLQQRGAVEDYSRSLSDQKWQDRVWVHMNIDQKRDYPFDFIIDFFFDDTNLAESPELYVGVSLVNQDEAVAVRRMADTLDKLLTACEGLGLTDAEYLKRPEWPAVHEAAKDLHALIVANDARMAGA